MDDRQLKEIVTAELRRKTPLADIQNILAEQHQHKITFMELRMLASELEDVIAAMAQDEDSAEELSREKREKEKTVEDHTGKTVVEISKLARPGSIANGTVKFASGASAEWLVDNYGRLALDKPQGKPTEDDMRQFQKELQRMLSGGV